MDDRNRRGERGDELDRDKGMSGSPGTPREKNAPPGSTPGNLPGGKNPKQPPNMPKQGTGGTSGSSDLGGPEPKHGSSPGGIEGLDDDDATPSRR